jgi:hypothetical protein
VDLGPTPRFMQLAREHRQRLETAAAPAARAPKKAAKKRSRARR